MEKEDKITFSLFEIPKNSRLAKYLKELPKAIKEKRLITFIQDTFHECFNFICLNEYIPILPVITTRLILTKNQFFKELEEQSKNSISKEEPKRPELTRAFVKSNTMYIEMESLIQILKEHGTLSFLMNLIEIYVHEIYHLAYPRKLEERREVTVPKHALVVWD
jgi:hypothetical protein